MDFLGGTMPLAEEIIPKKCLPTVYFLPKRPIRGLTHGNKRPLFFAGDRRKVCGVERRAKKLFQMCASAHTWRGAINMVEIEATAR
jgi:hypothetical protein